MRGADERATSRARELRRNSTVAEQKLRSFLKGRQVGNAKFVRQEPIGPYFADFACRKAKLVIEIDGVTHGTVEEKSKDAIRTAELQKAGYRVIRFSNEEIFGDLEPVLELIIRNFGR
jgi:very-short-patch-repair endonuclease